MTCNYTTTESFQEFFRIDVIRCVVHHYQCYIHQDDAASSLPSGDVFLLLFLIRGDNKMMKPSSYLSELELQEIQKPKLHERRTHTPTLVVCRMH